MPTPRSGYFIDGVKQPSVTQVLGMCSFSSTDALCQWSANLARKGEDWKASRNRSGQVGTASHAAIEHYPVPPKREEREEGVEPWTEEEWARIEAAFRNHGDFVQTYCPQIVVQEVQLTSRELRCGGTPDLVVKMKGKTYLLDHKTSKSLDAKVVGQCAAYAAMLAEQYGIVVDGALVMHHQHSLRLKVVELTLEDLAKGLEAFKAARLLFDLEPAMKSATYKSWEA